MLICINDSDTHQYCVEVINTKSLEEASQDQDLKKVNFQDHGFNQNYGFGITPVIKKNIQLSNIQLSKYAKVKLVDHGAVWPVLHLPSTYRLLY